MNRLRWAAALLLAGLMLGLSGCGGDVDGVAITIGPSEMYTTEDIRDGVDVILDYFRKNFDGCTLTEISYAGDERNGDYLDFALRNGRDEVLVLVSSFDVDASGGDGSLEPNGTYTGWRWILMRDAGGKWVHVDHGYG